MYQLAHVGIPTTFQQENEIYSENLRVYLTEPSEHQYQVEYLRFVPGTPLPDILTKQNHVAYYVDNLEVAMQDGEVIVPPMEASPTRRIAFILKDSLPIELIEDAK